ncbi:hypothetical protein pah_c188o051 [Parachlamydia acanthamoebae str. Hall's coccus]|nr:hypothetical protein pah_c188o051 [Parachlamydia acanthamoebae str. Hall's coccus]
MRKKTFYRDFLVIIDSQIMKDRNMHIMTQRSKMLNEEKH